MLQAVLVSKLRPGQVKQACGDLETDLQVHVQAVVEPGVAKLPLTGIDLVLVHHEVIGHADHKVAQNAAARGGVACLTLSRKRCQWGDLVPALSRIQPKGATAMQARKNKAQPSVPLDKLDAALVEYAHMKHDGLTHRGMVPTMRRYWAREDGCTDGSLQQFIGGLLRGTIAGLRAPDWFAGWRKTFDVDHVRAQSLLPPRPVPVLPPPHLALVSPAPPSAPVSGVHAVGDPAPAPQHDPMAPLWEEENAKLRAEIAMLRAKDVLRDAGINPKPEVMAAFKLLLGV